MTPRMIAVVTAALVSVGVLSLAVSRPGPTAAPPSPTATPPADAPDQADGEARATAGSARAADAASDGRAGSDDRSGAGGSVRDAAAIDFLNVRIQEPAALIEEQREADLLRRELEEMGLVDEDAPGE